MAMKEDGHTSGEAQAAGRSGAAKAEVKPGGQGRVKDPSTDRRLKQNRDKRE